MDSSFIPDNNLRIPASAETAARIRQITWIGLVINILLSAVKFILGFIGNSQAVVADAVHSLSDLSTDIAVLFGVKYWTRSPDQSHPYGHGRIETLVTLLIGAALAAVGIGIGYTALATIREPHMHRPGWLAFTGAALSIVFKELLYRWTVKVSRRVKSSALAANAWHHRSDALSSIPVAVAVAAAAIYPGLSILDHAGAVVVSVFILYAAWVIVAPGVREILGGGASEQFYRRIEELVLAVPDVKSMHKMRARKMGGGWFVDLHVQVDGDLTIQHGHEICGQIERRLTGDGAEIIDVVTHIEPFEDAGLQRKGHDD